MKILLGLTFTVFFCLNAYGSDSEYMLLLKFVTNLEKEVKEINRDMLSLGNSVLSNQNISDQIEKLAIREQLAREQSSKIETKLNSLSLDKNKFDQINKKMQSIDISALKKELNEKHESMKADILLVAYKNSQEQFFGLTGIILAVLSGLGALAMYTFKRSQEMALEKQVHMFEEEFENQREEFSKYLITIRSEHNKVLDKESYKRALVYNNIAISTYETRF